MSQIKKPNSPITWKLGQPYSSEFDDIFFSTESGLVESEYIFLEHNHLRQRFSGQQHMTIAEVGFGFGLNFLMTLSHFRQSFNDNPNHSLDYIGIEKYPPSAIQLQQALSPWSHLDKDYQTLLQHYPPPMAGIIRCHWPDIHCRLTLLIGDIDWAMSELVSPVDAWYFDGFSPAKTPMWSESVFKQAAMLSHATTTYATFSSRLSKKQP